MNKSGIVRIKDHHWDTLTNLAVKCSVQLQMPVNQATVLHAIMDDLCPELDTKEVCEMVLAKLKRKSA